MRMFLLAFCLTVAIDAQTYSTSFDLTESPISEGGAWINGRVAGKDWADVKTANGRATGLQIPSSYCLDNTAILAGSWGPDQTVTATVYNALPSSGGAPEIELRLRSTITAHVNSGYEILMSAEKNDGAYLTVVRWNGPPCDYTFVEPITYTQGDGQGTECIVRTGDVVKATMIGNEIKVYYNGVLKLTTHDNVFTTGAPGIGMDYVGSSMSTLGTFGFNDFSATATGGATAVAEALRPVHDRSNVHRRCLAGPEVLGAPLLIVRPDGRTLTEGHLTAQTGVQILGNGEDRVIPLVRVGTGR